MVQTGKLIALLGVFEGLVHHKADKKFNCADDADDAVVIDVRLCQQEHEADYQQHDAADHKFATIVFGEDTLHIDYLFDVVQLVILSTH